MEELFRDNYFALLKSDFGVMVQVNKADHKMSYYITLRQVEDGIRARLGGTQKNVSITIKNTPKLKDILEQIKSGQDIGIGSYSVGAMVFCELCAIAIKTRMLSNTVKEINADSIIAEHGLYEQN